MTVLDKQWHTECVRCHTCGDLLDHKCFFRFILMPMHMPPPLLSLSIGHWRQFSCIKLTFSIAGMATSSAGRTSTGGFFISVLHLVNLGRFCFVTSFIFENWLYISCNKFQIVSIKFCIFPGPSILWQKFLQKNAIPVLAKIAILGNLKPRQLNAELPARKVSPA